jgi:TRAP-type C4-dicarboxylate transport system permease small subunit
MSMIGELLNMLKRLEKIFDSILVLLSVISGIIFIFIMSSVCIDVVMRYFINRPMKWVIEISEYLLVYMTFLGTAWVLRQDGHVTVDILTVRLNPKFRVIVGIISSLIGVLVCLIIVWFGTIETWDNFERGVRIPSILEFPKAPLLAVIPFGSFFLMIQFIRRAFGFIKKINWIKNGSERNESKWNGG